MTSITLTDRIWTKVLAIMVMAALFALLTVFMPTKAHAISNILPELSAQGDPSSMAIGRLGDSNTLPTSEATAKFIFRDAPSSVLVFDGPYCLNSNYDRQTQSSSNPCSNGGNMNQEVYYDFQALNNDTGALGPVLRVRGTTMAGSGGVNGNYEVDLSGLQGVARSTDNKFFVRVRVHWAMPNPASCTPTSPLSSTCRTGSNLFRFSVRNSYDFITYAVVNGDPAPLTVQTIGPGFSAFSDVTLPFAARCSASAAELNQPLRWRDADYGEGNQSGNISWDLIDDSASGGPQLIASQSNGQLGGQDESRSYNVTFIAGHKYRWIWRHVDDNNAVEAFLPFDSYNYLQVCPPPPPAPPPPPPTPPATPPTGTVNPPTPGTPPGGTTGNPSVNSSCTTISGQATDPNSPGFLVPIRVNYSNGTQSTTTANGPGGTFSVSTPAAVRNSLQPIQVTVTGTSASGTTFTLSGSPITIGPCLSVSPSCGPFGIDPATPDPAEPFTITASVVYGSPAEVAAVAATNPRFYLTINGPGVNYSQIIPHTVNGSSLEITVARPATGTTGSYQVSWGVMATAGAINCAGGTGNSGNPVPPGPPNPPGTPEFIIANKPYFSVQGGDVSAGSRMSVAGAECVVAPSANAGVASWNRGLTGAYGGAGGQFAGLTLGRLQEFATAAGTSQAPSGLAFANNGDGDVRPDDGLYGGRFGPGCSKDYLDGVPSAQIQTNDVTIGGINVPDCTGSNSAACRQSVYVRGGDVFINGNITFDGAYGSSSAIPGFKLVVAGNIYIGPGVTRLDGVYIAQPSSPSATDGNIYTCGSAYSPATLTGGLDGACNQALTVNGSFSGRQVWLLRTAGTVSGATVAETFNFVPELWLSSTFGGSPTGGLRTYDSISNLPPVL